MPRGRKPKKVVATRIYNEGDKEVTEALDKFAKMYLLYTNIYKLPENYGTCSIVKVKKASFDVIFEFGGVWDGEMVDKKMLLTMNRETLKIEELKGEVNE